MPGRSTQKIRGFTFVELMFGTVMIVLCTVLLISHLASHYQQVMGERRRVLAYSIARSTCSEVQARSNHVSMDSIVLAPVNMPVTWEREFDVQSLVEAGRRLRRVTVAITVGKGKQRRHIATMSSVVPVPRMTHQATRVMDLYLLAIENLAGRGESMEGIRARTEAAIDGIEERHPGLRFRTHWITKASYGRDRGHVSPAPAAFDEFTVATSSVKGLVAGAIDRDAPACAYALADRGNPGMRLLAEREFHRARIEKIEQRHGAILRARALGTISPRLLDDMSVEPTWRLLLEDFHSAPERYRGALIINLHGDVLPMPALRNVSDPAKAPRTLPRLRCVTHPETLRVRRDPLGEQTMPVVLLVHAFTATQGSGRPPASGVCPSTHAITLQIEGVDLTDRQCPGRLLAGVTLESLAGGVAVTPAGAKAASYDYRSYQRAKDVYQPRGENEMFYVARFVDPGYGEPKFTRIWLFHTPVRCPTVRNSGVWQRADWVEPSHDVKVAGDLEALLAIAPRDPRVPDTVQDPAQGAVQGLFDSALGRSEHDYVPGAHDRDLATPGKGPKNSARWRLTIQPSVLTTRRFVDSAGVHGDPDGDVCLRVRTEFHHTSGQAVGSPSTTYVWWSSRASAVPLTERSQFLGRADESPYRNPDRGRSEAADYVDLIHRGLRQCRAVLIEADPTADLSMSVGGEQRVEDLIPIDRGDLGNWTDPDMNGSEPAARGLTRIVATLERLANSERLVDQLPPQVELAPLARSGRIVDPRTIVVRWKTLGSAARPVDDLEFALLYSRDHGLTWFYPQDGELARPGGRHSPHHCLANVRVGKAEFVMVTPPGKFGSGPLTVRIETWRRHRALHYAHHMREVDITR